MRILKPALMTFSIGSLMYRFGNDIAYLVLSQTDNLLRLLVLHGVSVHRRLAYSSVRKLRHDLFGKQAH